MIAMGPGDEDNLESEVIHRPNWEPNPNQYRPPRVNPNQDVLDMPERIDDPTSIEWME